MLSYNHYKLIEDLNKKLFLYKNTYVEEKEYFFNDSKMYDIALKLKNNSKSNNSFSYEDIIPISSELWKLLLKSNNCYTEVFKEWLEIVKNNFKYLDNILKALNILLIACKGQPSTMLMKVSILNGLQHQTLKILR